MGNNSIYPLETKKIDRTYHQEKEKKKKILLSLLRMNLFYMRDRRAKD